MRLVHVRGLMAAGAVALPPAVATAQAEIRGRVVDVTGLPLSYANIQLNSGQRYVADDSGRFQVPYNVPGGASLFVRRIGFEPVAMTLRERPDTALLIQMKPIPVQLKGVVVTGASA